jgi:hypothetical protein
MIFLRYGSKMDERIIEFDVVCQQQEHHCQNQTTGIGAVYWDQYPFRFQGRFLVTAAQPLSTIARLELSVIAVE